jgi:hypothetical protein
MRRFQSSLRRRRYRRRDVAERLVGGGIASNPFTPFTCVGHANFIFPP